MPKRLQFSPNGDDWFVMCDECSKKLPGDIPIKWQMFFQLDLSVSPFSIFYRKYLNVSSLNLTHKMDEKSCEN